MENEIIINKLNRIEKYIFGLKEILTVEELAEYTGFRQSYIYKLVHTGSIPYSKPNGKKLFFSRKEIDEWLLRNKHKSLEDIETEAIEYSSKSKNIRYEK
ncbi:DNA-binding protein [Capnocytophaga cynodegmi]|uniref:DNA-binding protein n=1 Tax=Capnocytophaga cynodegmi TaxID=28189 RepID=A0A250E8A7_9FLAO|nr:helix-turn-helix domain-containing protein [Capnocytophaga cynodegmi]ATA69183.1 DNA-binding protein [Capnocytophaga cynodegmi]